MFSFRPFRFTLVAGLISLIGITAAPAQEIVRIEHQGAKRDFILVEDEVVLTGRTHNADRLRQDIETAIAGAQVLEVRGNGALTKLPRRIDRRKAAARQEVMQHAAPELRSDPVFYFKDAVRTLETRRYGSPRVLVQLRPGQTPEQLRALSKALAAEATPLPGQVLLTFADGWESLGASEALEAQGQSARPLLRKFVEKMGLPPDPYFTQQWHLRNRGQGGGTIGIDANVAPAWDFTRGEGVTVVVVDDSLQTTHEDLAPNTFPAGSGKHKDFRDDDANPAPSASDDAHGTSVAGVIAARAKIDPSDPSVGGSGAAPAAQLLGVRLIGDFFDEMTTYEALNWQPDGVVSSISNNSWGYTGVGMINLDALERQALRDAAAQRRGGLGQITLFAAANNDEMFNGFVGGEPTFTSQDANYQPFANSRFVIGVGACTNFGDHAYYSNRGASILVCAPSNGGSRGIFTTDNMGGSGYNSLLDPAGQAADLNYTNAFGGTSSATPLTAGVVALMLSRNANLGYRDVQEILASTARQIDATNPDWQMNGAGFHFAHAYGAGMVDAAAAVARSTQWLNLAAGQSHARVAAQLPVSLPDNGTTPTVRTFDFSTSQNLRVEHVEVALRATHPNRSDLEIALISPSGTRSVLNPIRERPDPDYHFDDDRNIGDGAGGGWVYMTTHCWGENSSGTWTLTAQDRRSGSQGTLDQVQVRVHGTPAGFARLRFGQQQVTAAENSGTVNIAVERIGSTSGNASVAYAVVGGTAANGSDFSLANGTLNFADGESVKNISVQILDDADPEGAESAYLFLNNPIGARLGGSSLCTLTIAANDGNLLSIATIDPEAAETFATGPNPQPKNVGVFAVTRLVSDSALTVPISIGGSAINGSDYKVIPETVTFNPGEETAFIRIDPNNDDFFEGNEEVTVTLLPGDPLVYTLDDPSTATLTLRDNEVQTVNMVVPNDQTLLMENGTKKAIITIARDAAATSSDLKVDLLIGGSAQPGVDYVETPSSVTLTAGQQSTTLEIQPKDNDFYNPTRNVAVAIRPRLPEYKEGFQREVNVRIANNEPAPDPKAPLATIATPANHQRIDAAAAVSATATGTAKDNLQVRRVLFRVNETYWQIADGTISWTANLAGMLRPGSNTLFVRAEDQDGNFSPTVERSFTVVQPRSLNVSVVGLGTVTPGSGFFEAGQAYKLTARPATGQVFAGWSGDLSGSGKILNFIMPNADINVTANFAANPFVDGVTGRYAGLVLGDTSALETTGLLDLILTKTGAFSSKLSYGGVTYSLKGEFNALGKFDGAVKRKKLTPLAVSLSLDLDPFGTQSITGTVTGDAFPSTLAAHRCPYDGKTNLLSSDFARTYTFHLPPKYPTMIPSDDATKLKPRGNGVATLGISSAGVVKWVGVLGDGSPVTQSTVIGARNDWPLYLALYKGRGYIAGNVAHDPTDPGTDLSATLNWIKSPIPRDRLFPAGFVIEDSSLLGEIYTPPSNGQRVIPGYDNAPGNAGPLLLVEGNLTAPGIAKTLSLSSNNVATIAPIGTDKLRISISARTGMVGGHFAFPVTKKVVPIKGVVLQNKIGKGIGFFRGSVLLNGIPQTGRLEFSPSPP